MICRGEVTSPLHHTSYEKLKNNFRRANSRIPAFTGVGDSLWYTGAVVLPRVDRNRHGRSPHVYGAWLWLSTLCSGVGDEYMHRTTDDGISMVRVGTGTERIYSARAFVPVLGSKIESKELTSPPPLLTPIRGRAKRSQSGGIQNGHKFLERNTKQKPSKSISVNQYQPFPL